MFSRLSQPTPREIEAFVSAEWIGKQSPMQGLLGPVPATSKTVAADYVYAMQFESGKITHMTKIWNDAHSLKQLGWA